MKNTNTLNRRNFIQKTGVLMSAAMVGLPSFSKAGPAAKYKMGLQLFTIRDAMAADAAGSLKKAASVGYQDLETYGLDATQGKYYGYKAKDFKKVIEDLGLTTSSGHYDLFLYLDKSAADLRRYVDQCIEGAWALGQRYITWPWLQPQHRSIESFKLLTEKLNTVGEQVTEAGLGFAYHNHDFEFINHNGQYGYEIILAETDPALVKLQIDLYWVMHSSPWSPAEIFDKQPGRFVMWHVKDMDKKSRDYTELGNGSIDYRPILPHAARSGMEYYFIEQGGNFAQNSMKSIIDSAKFFKENLEGYL